MAYIGPNATEVQPIEMDNIGSLGSLILPELPQCDDKIIQMQLAYALREFCRESNACVIAVPMAAVTDSATGESVYPMPAAPDGMVVGSVIEVLSNGVPVAFEVRDYPSPHIAVNGYVADGDRVLVRFSAYPKAGGEECPAWFKERYAEAITAGAMHHLLSMSKRPWSDTARAVEYGAKYADAIAEASYRSLGSAAQGGSESAIPGGGIFM